ncbi:MAG: ACT domain-containing protein [Candidatus Aenigmarchaeota archaeon]|nr:ACT domain-containing protein [Candidatus Aenigmarchaeota archaeon]
MAGRSVAKLVYAWLRERPYLVYALKKDVINFSSVSREIQRELGIRNFDAVIVAVRRFQRDIRVLKSTGKELIDLFRRSRLEIKTGVNVYIVRPHAIRDIQKSAYLHLVKGSSAVTVLTDYALDIDCIKKKENMLEVKIISPPEIENAIGVMAYVCSALAERGINIEETYSCYTDTILVFDKRDLSKVVETLESIGIR